MIESLVVSIVLAIVLVAACYVYVEVEGLGPDDEY